LPTLVAKPALEMDHERKKKDTKETTQQKKESKLVDEFVGHFLKVFPNGCSWLTEQQALAWFQTHEASAQFLNNEKLKLPSAEVVVKKLKKRNGGNFFASSKEWML
jgi:hypothetical protein